MAQGAAGKDQRPQSFGRHELLCPLSVSPALPASPCTKLASSEAFILHPASLVAYHTAVLSALPSFHGGVEVQRCSQVLK